jgi:hypothetical protein
LCNKCEYRKDKYTDEEANLLHAVCEVQDYVNFGDLCMGELGIQTQYGAHLLEGLAGCPVLGTGLRIKGDDHNYHSYLIHKDDAETFKQRVKEWWNR